MTTTASNITESEHTIHELLEEIRELRERVLQLATELEALHLDQFILAPAVIVEEKLRVSLQLKVKLDSDISRLEQLKIELRATGYRW